MSSSELHFEFWPSGLDKLEDDRMHMTELIISVLRLESEIRLKTSPIGPWITDRTHLIIEADKRNFFLNQ